jgi:hypothetical protein
LEVDIKDDEGKTPADYLEEIDDVATRVNIQNALAGKGAQYGLAGNHITAYNPNTPAITYAAHDADSDVKEVSSS